MSITSDLVDQHFFFPRNVGDLDDTAFIGLAGSVICGASVRMSIKVNESQTIVAAKFKAIGCSSLIAGASMLTEAVIGKTTGEAAAIAQAAEAGVFEDHSKKNGDRDRCAALARDATIAAIKRYSDTARSAWEGEEALICTCFCVSERTIEHEINKGELRTIAEVTRACKAGAGCRSCYPLIDDILADYWHCGTGIPACH